MKTQTLVCCLLVLLLTEYGHAANKSSNTKDTTKTTTKTSSSSSTTTTVAPASTKANEKLSYPKKVNTLKKRPTKSTSLKKVADITDKFKDLPADDLAFIKELDKQFKQHGGKVKIKVENDNSTAPGSSGKNSKRTIEGELGYGYSHNGYNYNPPKFEFYPYSQKDIPSDGPKYFLPNGKTEVSVEPSYSYELKPQTYVTHNDGAQVDLPQPEQPQHQQFSAEQHHPQQAPQQQQQYEEPVIVLRIPGPAKYASHLQTLLQQYLEIRAAQYLRILEEAEQQRNLQHQQQQQHYSQQQLEHEPQHQQQQLQEIDYGQHAGHVEEAPAAAPIAQEHHQEYQQQQVQYEEAPQAQYPPIDDVYQTYKYKHPTHPEQAQQPESQAYYQAPEPEQQHQPQQHYAPQAEQPQYYYAHQQEYAQPEGPPATYQHVFLISMAPQAIGDYANEPQQQHQHQHQAEEPHAIYVPEQPVADVGDHAPLPITENNPRPSHTKVIFTHNPEHAGTDYSNMYPLPSIKPNERHAPHSVPDYHQDYQQQIHASQAYQQQESHESMQHYQQQQVSVPQHQLQHQQPQQQQQVVAITQRPFNYHAHGTKPRARGRINHKRRASAADAAEKADQDLKKITDFVRDKFGAEKGSTVEYKTTQVISTKK